jgi:hypothetical protein
MTSIRKLLLIGVALIVVSVHSCHARIEANFELSGKLETFIASDQAEISVASLVGPGWSKVCAVPVDEFFPSQSKARSAKMDLVREIVDICEPDWGESGQWCLALYEGESLPTRAYALSNVPYVSDVPYLSGTVYKDELAAVTGRLEFCTPVEGAVLAKSPTGNRLFLAKKANFAVTAPG